MRGKEFIVGTGPEADFSPDKIDSIIYKIALWFQKPEAGRTYDDPVDAARKKVKECLMGIKEDGSPWGQVPAKFEDRVRAKCSYDLDADQGIPARRGKSPLAVAAEHRREAAKGLEEIPLHHPSATGFDADKFRQEMEKNILLTFPELDNPAHIPNIRSLTMYYAERERIDLQLAMGTTDKNRLLLLDSLKRLEEMADTTMKRLGVHPDQVRKKISDKGASTIADLVALISDDTDYKDRERIWALQTALQLWWMRNHRNGAGTGPQVHDFEIWHMTRSRPVNFKCRHGETYRIVEGFEVKELYDYLTLRGVTIEEPVIPGLITQEDLFGLKEYFEEGTYVENTNGADGAGSGVGQGTPSS